MLRVFPGISVWIIPKEESEDIHTIVSVTFLVGLSFLLKFEKNHRSDFHLAGKNRKECHDL